MLRICRCSRPRFVSNAVVLGSLRRWSQRIQQQSTSSQQLSQPRLLKLPFASAQSLGYRGEKPLGSVYDQTIQLLVRLSNQASMLELPEKPVENVLYHGLQSNERLPDPPNGWGRDSLRQYLEQITRTNYTNSGMRLEAERLIRYLLLDGGTSPASVQSVEAYNAALVFAFRNRNLKLARSLYQNMWLHRHLHPDLVTFKLFLLSSRQRWKNGWNEFPLQFVNNILRKMFRRGIQIDAEVWNIVLVSTHADAAPLQVRILDQMEKRDIPFSRRGLAMMVDRVMDEYGPTEAFEYLQQEKLKLSIEIINSMVARVLDDDQPVQQAWALLHRALDTGMATANAATLNTIIERLIPTKRLDICLGILSGLGHEAHPTPWTFNLLFKTALRIGHRGDLNDRFRLLELIYGKWCQAGVDKQRLQLKQMARLQDLYYRHRGWQFEPLNLRPVLSQEQEKQWDELCDTLRWGKVADKVYCHYTEKTRQSEMASRVLGVNVLSLHPNVVTQQDIEKLRYEPKHQLIRFKKSLKTKTFA